MTGSGQHVAVICKDSNERVNYEKYTESQFRLSLPGHVFDFYLCVCFDVCTFCSFKDLASVVALNSLSEAFHPQLSIKTLATTVVDYSGRRMIAQSLVPGILNVSMPSPTVLIQQSLLSLFYTVLGTWQACVVVVLAEIFKPVLDKS